MINAEPNAGPNRPQALPVIAENVPVALRALDQWVLWRYEQDQDGKWTKIPYKEAGGRASSTNREGWTSVFRAEAAYKRGQYDGIGWVCTQESGIVGADLDHCFDPVTKKWEPWAIEIIKALDSYTERSPSGTGVRIFVKGTLPEGRRKKGPIEMYVSGRYLTITGHLLKNLPKTIEDRQAEIQGVYAKFLQDDPKKTNGKPSGGNGAWHPSDDELLRKALAAKNGDKLRRLLDGDTSDHAGDDSAADLSLCSLLAFWTQDPAQIDRIFRRSGLYRDKWNSRRGDSTYGEWTINKALEGTTEHYRGNSRSNAGSNHSSGAASDTKDKSHASAYPYAVENGVIVRFQTVKEGQVISQPLCNFDARITEEIVLDDGAEPQRAFMIEGRLDTGTSLSATRVPVARFPTMNWVGESWGRCAIVNAGTSTKDHLRVAIQKLSYDARDRYVFTHTGWRKIGGQWLYLSGSISGDSGFEVELTGELSRYRLPIAADDPVSAMKTSLQILHVAPLRITAPLIAATFRAPLCSAYPQDLSIWLEGRTGSMKSTLAALILNHFGEFTRTQLPGNWECTANQLEHRAFILKDSLFVVDEYVPTGLNRREIETKASRLLRAQGNLAGRGRLRSDLTERPAFYPRGIIISTGEEHPPGQSLLARTIVIELSRDEIDVALLTALQAQAGRFSHAMAGYISWLAPQMDDMPGLLKETFLGARTQATAGGEHLRIPEGAAHLWLGIHSALTYAQEIGAITESEADRLRSDCWSAFIQIGKDQATLVEDEQPVRRFLGVLHTIITQGRVVLVGRDEGIPEPKSGVDFIGWKDPEWLYLLPEATFQSVMRFCRDTGDHFAIGQARLKRDLKKDGISKTDTDRLTATAWIGTRSHRVLQLNVAGIEKVSGTEGWL